MSAEHEDVDAAASERLPGPFTRRRPQPDSADRIEQEVPRAEFHRGKAREKRETMRTRYAVPPELLEEHDEHVFYEALDVVDVALRELAVGTFAHEEIAKALVAIRRTKVSSKKAGG